jgi:hypothetical protein
VVLEALQSVINTMVRQHIKLPLVYLHKQYPIFVIASGLVAAAAASSSKP